MIKKNIELKETENIKEKEVEVFLETVLNLFITLAKLGAIQCNETKKELRNGKT